MRKEAFVKSNEIRNKFIKFFEDKAHEKYDSSSLVPHNDPTLLFTNAGMNQFKDFFTGAANPANRKAVSVQKCVRAGGKHNDLENVGFTSRHHTFFEMLGNFSFGDYFKKEAISYAWELLTKEFKIPKDKLFITVHTSDQEAADIWHDQEGVPRDRIFFLGDKDNFWEMGEIGPCGPCSEIFYDHGPERSDKSADISSCILNDEDRYIEIWNLVFMQYEKFHNDKGEVERRKLPKPSVDTGAGLERIAAALQSSYNNFDTDCFKPIISKIESLSSKKYKENANFMRVVADHARSTSMLLNDGVIPSNEGRGYVLRRIIRRAVLHLDYLGVKETSLYKLTEAVFTSLGDEYKACWKNQAFVEKYLKSEEDSFRKTLSSGLKLLEKEIAELKGDTLSGASAFSLYDTHGFPIDLTELILAKRNLKLDQAGFDKKMQQQKERSRSAGAFVVAADESKAFYGVLEKHGATKFTGYTSITGEGKLLSIGSLNEKIALVFDSTPFYAESGGQAGDLGRVELNGKVVATISDTKKPVDGLHVLLCDSDVKLEIGKSYKLIVDQSNRNLSARNHTATHLLQAALVKTLGAHVKQSGSFVGPERMRFDFTHPEGLKASELKEVENLVNEQIQAATNVVAHEMTKDQAMDKGATALFGEKYADKVRVVDVAGFSIELCGGTHVQNTNDIGIFKIVSEGSLSAGIRRIEAVSSLGAISYSNEKIETLSTVETLLGAKGDLLISKLEGLMKDLNAKNKEIKALNGQVQSAKSKDLFNDVEELANGVKFKYIAADESADIRKLGDLFMDKFPKGVTVIASSKGDKTAVLIRTFKGNKDFNCSIISKDVFSALDGRGGGKPDMAQGSIPASRAGELEELIRSKMG
jgi:alanyl-tRNA synthetase